MGKLIIHWDKPRSPWSAIPNRLAIASYGGEYERTNEGHFRFLTSGNLRVLYPVVIDAFLVGGGGGAYNQGSTYPRAGAGSGYTTTQRSITLSPFKVYRIVIGEGGKASAYNSPTDGGDTSAFELIARGGRASTRSSGGDGGSGGGTNGLGGVDGEDGANASSALGYERGRGQLRTTRAFEDEDGVLYARGGNGGVVGQVYKPVPNSGNGGDGGYYADGKKVASTAGSSGVVVIREAVS